MGKSSKVLDQFAQSAYTMSPPSNVFGKQSFGAKSMNSEDFQSIMSKLEGKSNFYAAKPNLDYEGLKMSRFWFEGVNKNLANKRSQEELLVVMKDWSVAK